jgi:tRNA G18 (ribose-2'-O)-methylase SpoU
MKKLKLQELGRVSVEEFKKQEKTPIILVLDNIRSMHNVGSAFRTADAFACQKIYLCGITAKPPHREIHKTALGASDSVSWEYFKNVEDALKQIKTEGYQTIAVEQTDKSSMLQGFEAQKGEKYAFVFGNEVFGVSDEALPFCDLALEIPQIGTKHSLNISVSLGIVIWHTYSSLIS